MKKDRIHPTADQQFLLDTVRVRLIEAGELARWQSLVEEHHYLRDATLVGECLRYVAEGATGQWVALLGFCSAAYHLKAREVWLGWSSEQQQRRRRLVGQNSRFLILPWVVCPNLASRVLTLAAARVSADWTQIHGHGLLLLESFVDPERYHGTCYRAAGWQRLGGTRGYARSGRDFYQAHDRPKELWVLPLHPQSARWLRAPALPPALAAWESEPPPRSALCSRELESLLEVFWPLHDARRAQARRYRVGCVVALAAAAVLAGARTYADLAVVAAQFSQPQLRHLRCWQNPKTQRYEAPRETTFWRVLSAVDPEELDGRLGSWLEAQAPPTEPIAIDGKCLRGAQFQRFAAFLHEAQAVVAQVRIEEKSNEIPAVAPLLAAVEIAGRVGTADALHTQRATAHHLVQERGADYLFVVKDNQPSLRARCERLLPESAFSPST
jgi:hypothetical protein